MFIRKIRPEEKEAYNAAVGHPLQSWEWGQFRQTTGLELERIGIFDKSKLVKALQVTFHPVPILNKNIGYLPKGYMPDADQLGVLRTVAKEHNAIFIKLEPNVASKVGAPSAHSNIAKFLLDNDCVPGKPLFTKYTFQLDLTQEEDILFKNLSSKTRYNVNVAYKKGVQIFENTSAEGMEQYIAVLEETTKRQGFYAHSPEYFRKMWKELGNSGMLKIFNAVYEGEILTSWIMFIFNGVLYYPYGASRDLHRDVMASNLMMWEMIRFGKQQGCTLFDMWGSLGPEPNEKDPWFGFHRFKKGYGGDLVEFLGTFDYVVDFPLYQIFKIGDSLRWKFLRLKAKLKI
ncbi:MAG: peptidoglycan bridge formation protein FemAB [Patescibacteria group bacterium]|nr:MAG: peptidoglycan bridge formation protein FemAB [Patescibacteria group bacterium]